MSYVPYLPSHFHYGRLRGGPAYQCLAFLIFFQSAHAHQPSEIPSSKLAFAKVINNKFKTRMTWPFLGSIWNDWRLFSWSSFLPWILVLAPHWFTPPLWPSLPSPPCWSSCLLSPSHLTLQFVPGNHSQPTTLSTTCRLFTLRFKSLVQIFLLSS